MAPRAGFEPATNRLTARLDAQQVNALLEVGIAYLDLEQTLVWAMDKAAACERQVAGLLQLQVKLHRLANSLVAVPEFH